MISFSAIYGGGGSTVVEGCMGRSGIGTPTLRIIRCPECGSEMEMFSTDVKAVCGICGFTAYNDIQTCVQWCPRAEECVGTEMYRKLNRVEERSSDE